MAEREVESRETKIIHRPIREMVLTSNPPQYYCVNEKGERNPCYCHPCGWTGWDDYEEWLDRPPVSRGELKSALVNSADQARVEGRAEALAEVVEVLLRGMADSGWREQFVWDEVIATVREMGEK